MIEVEAAEGLAAFFLFKNETWNSQGTFKVFNQTKTLSMSKPEMSAAEHNQLVELMQSLASMQFKMARVKNMFPNYHQQLQHTYNQMLLNARRSNILPPWMTV